MKANYSKPEDFASYGHAQDVLSLTASLQAAEEERDAAQQTLAAIAEVTHKVSMNLGA